MQPVRSSRKLARPLARAAMFAAVRGLAYGSATTVGGTISAFIIWWILNR